MHRCIRSDGIPFGVSLSVNAIKHSSITVEHIAYTPWVVYGARKQPVKSTIENESGEPNEQRPDEKSFIHFRFACFVCIVLCWCRKGNERWESELWPLCRCFSRNLDCGVSGFTSFHRAESSAKWVKVYPLLLLNIIIWHCYSYPSIHFPVISSLFFLFNRRGRIEKFIKSTKPAPLSDSFTVCMGKWYKNMLLLCIRINRWHQYDSRDPKCAFVFNIFSLFSASALELRKWDTGCVLTMCSFLFTIIENTRASDKTRPSCHFCELARCWCRCGCAGARITRSVRNDCLYFVVIFDSHQDTQRLGNRLSPHARCWKKCGTWNVRCNHSHTIDCSLHLTPMCASFTTSNVNFICFTCVNFHLPWIWRCAIDVYGRFVLAARNGEKNK